MTTNICRFINKNNQTNDIHIINFVLETEKQTYELPRKSSYYTMNFVSSGEGFLQLSNSRVEIKSGDVFFTFPDVKYTIESSDHLEYIYISFLGTRPMEIMERLNINTTNYIFHNFVDELNLWKNFIESNSTSADIKAECVMLYTFSMLEEYLPQSTTKLKVSDTVSNIKKFIDEHIQDSDLSLDTVSQHFSYNKKYISRLFKNNLNLGFSDYVNTVRIQEACSLMQQGVSSVQDLAYFTGYKDPMYFSRVFKKHMKISPREFMKSLK